MNKKTIKIKINLPPLYSTDAIPAKDKKINLVFTRETRFGLWIWLPVEFNKESNDMFGFTNLADPQNAEWGYFNLEDIISNGAFPVIGWSEKTFEETVKFFKWEGIL